MGIKNTEGFWRATPRQIVTLYEIQTGSDTETTERKLNEMFGEGVD